MKLLLYCLLVILWPVRQTYAQNSTTKISPLTIGDKIPDVLFSTVLNSSVSSIKLSDFKNKAVILDFWATTCGSCVKSFPLIDSLQKQYSDKIQFLLVNPVISGDDSTRIMKSLARVKQVYGKEIELPVIFNDSIAFNFFGVNYVPLYVWLDEKRVIKAITGKKELNNENITAFLKGRKIKIIPKEKEKK